METQLEHATLKYNKFDRKEKGWSKLYFLFLAIQVPIMVVAVLASNKIVEINDVYGWGLVGLSIIVFIGALISTILSIHYLKTANKWYLEITRLFLEELDTWRY